MDVLLFKRLLEAAEHGRSSTASTPWMVRLDRLGDGELAIPPGHGARHHPAAVDATVDFLERAVPAGR